MKRIVFQKGRRYLGIVFHRSVIHVSLTAARSSGIKEAFTRTGKPPNRYDADLWIALPDDPADAVRVILEQVGDRQFRQTNRVVQCDNPARALADGYELITC